MGLVLMIMGGWYWSEAGAVGATAVYLLLIGFLMLVVGGIALFANFKKIWLILFVIELFNVALFLVLYIVIVIVLMMASGSSDPVTKSTKAAWDSLIEDLVLTGSDGAGGIYCQTATGGTACDRFWSTTLGPAQSGDGACDIADTELPDILANCSSIQLNPASDDDKAAIGFQDTALAQNCNSYYPVCDACSQACMQASITKIKDQMLPASYFTFFLCFYLFVVVCFNQIALGADELEGVLKIAGLVLNGLVVLFSFIAFIIAIIGMVDANDACPEGKDCVPTSMLALIFLGFALLVLGGLATGGIYINNNMLIRIATLVMILATIALLLAALLMGISSGAVMDDMGYYYDTNYPKLRSALEKGENSYCRLNEADCKTLTYDTEGTASVYPQSCDDAGACEDIVIDSESPYWTGEAYKMTAEDLWQDQYAILAGMAKAADAAAWLEPCATSGICIYCDDFYTAVETTNPGYSSRGPREESACLVREVWSNMASGDTKVQAESAYASLTVDGANQAKIDACAAETDEVGDDCEAISYCVFISKNGNCFPRDGTTETADVEACNAVKSDADLLDSTACDAVKLAADATVNACTYASREDYRRAPNMDFKVALAGSATDILTHTAATATTPLILKSYTDGQDRFTLDAATNSWSRAPCVATDPAIEAHVATCTAVDTSDAATAASNCAAEAVCTFTTQPMTVAEWTSMISNFTSVNDEAKFAMPKCESALTDYTADVLTCPETAEDATKYTADCNACNSAFSPFSFNFDMAMSEGAQQKCLNFFVGHIENECGGATTTCIDEVRPSVDGRCEGSPQVADEATCTGGGGTWTAVPTETLRKSHIDPIIADALAGSNNWCGYTDLGCKIKIQNSIEGSMTTIGVFGVIFLLFFVGIIFFTEQGIVIYKGGGGDDDDDDDDDDDSDE